MVYLVAVLIIFLFINYQNGGFSSGFHLLVWERLMKSEEQNDCYDRDDVYSGGQSR